MKKILQKIICFLTLCLFFSKDMGVFAIDYAIDFSTPSDYTVSSSTGAYVNNGLAQLKQQLSHTGVAVTGGTRLLTGAYDVAVDGIYAYITAYNSDAVEILNISNPASPTHVSSIVNNGGTLRLDGPTGIVKSGNYLYVASNLSDALQIIDVSTPASPIAAGQIIDDATKMLDGARGITKSGNNVYIASDTDDALAIIDVTTPTAPSYTGHIRNTTTLNGARGVKVSGNYAFVTAYDGDRFTVVNISNPSLPVVVKNISNNNGTRKLNGAWGIDVSGNYAYIASSVSNAVQIVNITDPLNPIVGANVTTATGSYQLNGVSGVSYGSGFLYTAGTTNDAISIIDVNIPETPVFVNSITHNVSNPLLDGVQNTVRVGTLLYAVSSVSNALEILRIGYTSSSPQISSNNSILYSGGIFSVSHILGSNNQGSIRYQISKDGGTTWYYFNGSNWVAGGVSYAQANDVTTINTNILTFHSVGTGNSFKIRAYLNSTSTQAVEIDSFLFETDTTGPTIDAYSPQDNLLFPIGNLHISILHSDSESGINTSSRTLALSKWNGSTWGADIASSYVNFTGSTVTSTGANFPISGLSYGKYRATYGISDRVGNVTSQEIIFYVDEVEFNINTGSVDIGSLPWGTSQFSTGELVVTVKTVGAGFNVHMTRSTNFSYDYGIIGDWDGSKGFGYDKVPYTGNIHTINTNELIGSQTGSLNTNGNKNTYTYTIKYGTLVNQDQIAGNYGTNISFGIAYDYIANGDCIIDSTPFSCTLQ